MTTRIEIGNDIRDAASVNTLSDRTFREAWQFAGSAVEVDLALAKEIHKDILRMERAPIMQELDVEYMVALEKGQSTLGIASKKQSLRDVTNDPRIDAASSVDELKSLTLTFLVGD